MENSIEKPPAVVRWPTSTTRSDTVRVHVAVLMNKPKKIIKYIKRGTPVDVYNNDGQPPIFCAALLGKTKVVKVLLELGANPNARCYPDGGTPVHAACYVGCTKSLKLLLLYGGDLRLTDSLKKTTYEWAIKQPDEVKRRNIRDILDGARICAFKSDGKEMLSEWKGRICTEKPPTRLLSLPCLGNGGPSMKNANHSEITLKHGLVPIGYGRVYFGGNGNDQRCGAVVGLPLINGIADLKLEDENASASWICGKFCTFVPMVWIERKTSVTVRELRKSTVEDAIPDILIAELNSLVKLHHPNILMLLAVCYIDNYDSISLVFEKVPLGSLFFVLYNQLKRLSSRYVTDLITQVCEALDFIHASGYLHGFVNSHSIFLVDNYRAKLGCFEYMTPIGANTEAVQVSTHPLIRSDSHLSTYRHWAAPEIITAKRPPSKASDVYSVCCVMWELIYGEVPWKDYTLESLRSMMSENPYARLPLDKRVVPQLWYGVLNMGLEPEVPLRDLDLSEVRDMMTLSKSRIDMGGGGGDGDGDGLHARKSSSRLSLKSYGDPVVESQDAVDADKLSLYGPQTAV